MPKRWLDLNVKKEHEMATKAKALMEKAEDCVSDVLFGLNTCLSECSNSRRLVFCRKDRYYYASYEARSLISAVLENLERAVFFRRLYAYFDLELDEADEQTIAVLMSQDKAKRRHSSRKSSLNYKTRQAQISKQRIATNIEAAEASKKRRLERSYTPTSQKKLNVNAFTSRRGPRTQEQLRMEFENGGKVNQCDTCGKFYKKAHKRCVRGNQRPSQAQRARPPTIDMASDPALLPKDKEEESSDFVVEDDVIVEACSIGSDVDDNGSSECDGLVLIEQYGSSGPVDGPRRSGRQRKEINFVDLVGDLDSDVPIIDVSDQNFDPSEGSDLEDDFDMEDSSQ